MPSCFECGAPAEHDHHVVPRIRGGTRTVPLCGVCHAKAHHRERNMASATLTREALAAKRNKGQRVGSIPWGYRLAADGVHLERCEREWRMIRRAKQLEARGLSQRAIARALNDEGHRNRAGRPFGHRTIGNILKAQPHDTIQGALFQGDA